MHYLKSEFILKFKMYQKIVFVINENKKLLSYCKNKNHYFCIDFDGFDTIFSAKSTILLQVINPTKTSVKIQLRNGNRNFN